MTNDRSGNSASAIGHGAFAPLQEPVYRRVWISSFLSNLGYLVMGVGAVWEMTRLTSSPEMVALVQTALMLPVMVIALPAGAVADMYDIRKIVLLGLCFAAVGATILAATSLAGLLTPWTILAACFTIGAGTAFYGPAWQASVRELVRGESLPAAVALGSISYNVARSFGPALGGMIVATAGSIAAFGANALFYLPIIFAFLTWRRAPEPTLLPSERMDRAILSGVRYAIHSPPIRMTITRAFAYGLVGAALTALAPIVAKELLGGGVATYGLLLGAYGAGAVLGVPFTTLVRDRLLSETAGSLLAFTTGVMFVVIGLSGVALLTLPAFAICGATWTLLISLLNVNVQLSAPRWVTGRILSLFQAALTGGIALGAWIWGRTALDLEVGTTLVISGTGLALSPLVTLLRPLSRVSNKAIEAVQFEREPEVALALTNRSGPIVVEVDYHIPPENARGFYEAMRNLQHVRLRNGGFNWSIARDIADPAIWTERYHCPTWADYLRQRDRFTQGDLAPKVRAESFLSPEHRPIARRRLERPFGSVRWQAGSLARAEAPVAIFTP